MSLAQSTYATRVHPAVALARRYRDAGIAQRIAVATPHELVAMLYDGGCEALAQARSATVAGDAAARVVATTRALRILDALDAALDHGRGGAVARALAAAYAQVRAVTVAGNAERRAELFAGAADRLGVLARAWGAIGGERRAAS